jgi:hypothetical protein
VESREKTFQSFLSRLVEDNYYYPHWNGDRMNKVNTSLVCILIAFQSPVRGIVSKVQDVNSELQLSIETELAGMHGL